MTKCRKSYVDRQGFKLATPRLKPNYKSDLQLTALPGPGLVCKRLMPVKRVYLSHIMRKPVLVVCGQQRRRSACTSMQSDQHLCCSLFRWNNTCSCYVLNFKTRASFCGCTGRFLFYLIANPEDRFSCDKAHLWHDNDTCITVKILLQIVMKFCKSRAPLWLRKIIDITSFATLCELNDEHFSCKQTGYPGWSESSLGAQDHFPC